MTNRNIISVSELVKKIKLTVDADYTIQNIYVKGEISNLSTNYAHMYFDIKDSKSRIKCIMFQTNRKTLKFMPKNGDEIIAFANSTLYQEGGQLQLQVKDIKLDGLGDLFVIYEQLKAKLAKEGYFDINHKKALPKYAMKIAIICGDNSAAYHDITKTIANRWPIAQTIFLPSLVQGNEASKNLIECIKKADQLAMDVIILARGGGSIEDLWAFNDEQLAKTIYHCNTPIVSGIGHEIDFTIADYVADYRASTPTAAAVVATNDINELIQQKDTYLKNITNNIINKIKKYHLNINYYKQNLFTFSTIFNQFNQKIIRNQLNINNQINNKLINYHHLIENNKKANITCINNILNQYQSKHLRLIKILDAYSPLKSLERGYSISMKNNMIIKNTNDIQINDLIDIRLTNGQIKTQVKEIINENI